MPPPRLGPAEECALTKDKGTANLLPALVRKFFTQYLVAQRRLSPCTVASYRDTFRLLLGYIQGQTHRSASQQGLEDWDEPHVLGFLDYLEKQRPCWARSRNARLAAIHAFMRFVAQQEPKHLALAGRVLAIPNKQHLRPVLDYLTVEQVKAIGEAPAPDSFSGRRDRLLFQLLDNTGARVSEIGALSRQDLLATCTTVTLHGKGKERTVSLWPKTARQLRQWLDRLAPEPSTPVFANRLGGRLSRFGIASRVVQATQKASLTCPSLGGRRVSPLVFRHTTAMPLLQAGVDITAIALWLGHASPLTTHQYIEANLEMKKQTLNRLLPPKGRPVTFKPRDALLAFLEGV